MNEPNATDLIEVIKQRANLAQAALTSAVGQLTLITEILAGLKPAEPQKSED